MTTTTDAQRRPDEPPPHSEALEVSFPAPHVLLLTLNRPEARNAISPTLARELADVLAWFDREPGLWCVVVTGKGPTFCAGADLKAWRQARAGGRATEQRDVLGNPHGFAALSRRASPKPAIAAVNGPAYGGGVEIVLNCDIVVASADAVFGFPEVARGVVAAEGGIPRLARVAGHQLASELLLSGKAVSAVEARDRFCFVNTVTPPASVLPTALAHAAALCAHSPDAVQSTKMALVLAREHGADEAVRLHARSAVSTRVYRGENIEEGLNAFVEKRAPKWVNPAKL